MKAKKPQETDEGGLCALKEAFGRTTAPFICFFLCLYRPVRSGVCVGAGVSIAPDREIIPNVPTRTCVRGIGIILPSPILPTMVSNACADDTSCTAGIDGDIVGSLAGLSFFSSFLAIFTADTITKIKFSPHREWRIPGCRQFQLLRYYSSADCQRPQKMLQRRNQGYAVLSGGQAVRNPCISELELHTAGEVGLLMFVREESKNAPVHKDVLKTLHKPPYFGSSNWRRRGEFCNCTTYSRFPSSFGCNLFSG